MTHAEAAVSPNYKKFLIATIENNRIGHFTIYDLDKINQALDKSGKYKDVSLDGFEYENSFTINNLYGNAEDAVVNSIQGYDLDNDGNIYISSQKAPDSMAHIMHIISKLLRFHGMVALKRKKINGKV